MGTARSVHAAHQDLVFSRRIEAALGQSRQSPLFARGGEKTLHIAQHANIRQIPVILGVVETIAYDELIGDLEASIRYFDGSLAMGWFIQQGGDSQRLRLPLG